jgi:3'-phosphoadenosine 5'-phosphosulfate sulfotransferase (PAPS reductase)/FAD synthetase
MNSYKLPEGNVQISFSGGRTSGYMLYKILEANNGLPDRAKVIFTNTGREMEETLDFVQECSHRWNVNIVWLEYDEVDGKNSFKEVSHNSASYNGEPFEKVILRYGRLPNALQRYCTGILKIQTASKYLKSLGWKNWNNCLGIRADEKRRLKYKLDQGYYPYYPIALADDTLVDVEKFWSKQPFKLRLPVVKGKTIMGSASKASFKIEK